MHVAAYAGLALVSAYATANRRDRPYRRIAVVVGIAVGYGALVELLQAPLARRHYSHADLLANAVGASLVSLWFVAERRVQYVHRPLIGDEA